MGKVGVAGAVSQKRTEGSARAALSRLPGYRDDGTWRFDLELASGGHAFPAVCIMHLKPRFDGAFFTCIHGGRGDGAHMA